MLWNEKILYLTAYRHYVFHVTLNKTMVLGHSSPSGLYNEDVLFSVQYEANLYVVLKPTKCHCKISSLNGWKL
jgi:hypothetical protein